MNAQPIMSTGNLASGSLVDFTSKDWYWINGTTRYVFAISHGRLSADNSRSAPEKILEQSYQIAKEQLLQELAGDNSERIWLESRQSMEDVTLALLRAKEQYEAKPMSKARKWIGILSNKLMFYAPVLDVLSQHHPEYVSLVWGAMKFLFTVGYPSMSPTQC